MTRMELCSVDCDNLGLCLVDSKSLWLVIIPKSKDQFMEWPPMKIVQPWAYTWWEVESRSSERCKSIGGDIDVDEEGSEQNKWTLAITTPQLCWLSICAHMSWPRQEGLSPQAQSRTQSRIEKNTTKDVDIWLTNKCGFLQTIERWNFF
jgi:hypothetical protein